MIAKTNDIEATKINSVPASASAPSIKLYRLSNQIKARTPSNIKIPEFESWKKEKSIDGTPPKEYTTQNAATNWVGRRTHKLKLDTSSANPRTAMREPPISAWYSLTGMRSFRNNEVATTKNTITTTAPPPLGIGYECALLLIG